MRSLRKRITGEIPRAKISFYEINKVGSNSNCPKSWWKRIIEKCLMGKTSVKVTIRDPSTGLQ